MNAVKDNNAEVRDFFEKLQLLTTKPSEIIELNFNSNSFLCNFWNRYKDIIYEKSLEPEYLKKYPKACEFIEIKYSQVIFNFNNKMEQYFKIIEELNRLPEYDTDRLFYDGSEIKSFWDIYREKIYQSSTLENYRKRYLKACAIIEQAYLTYHEKKKKNNLIFSEKMLILFNLIESANEISESILNYKIGEKETVESFFKNSKIRICLYSMSLKYKKQYPKATALLANKFKDNFSVIEERIKMFLSIAEEVWPINMSLNNLYFDDGSSIEEFYNEYKEVIYSVVISYKYNELYPYTSRYVIESYEKMPLEFEDRVEEFFRIVEDNIKGKVSFLLGSFSDGFSVEKFWVRNRERIYNLTNSGVYQKKYPKSCQLILSIKKKHEEILKEELAIKIRINRKLLNFFEIVEEKKQLPIVSAESKISDYSFWFEYKKELYKMAISDLYREKYPVACLLIKDRYIKESKSDEFDDINFNNLENYFSIAEEKLINGVKVNVHNIFGKIYLWYNNLPLLRNLSVDELFNKRYPRTCKLIRFELNRNEEKLKEFFLVVEEKGRIPYQSEDIYFTNGAKMNQYWKDYKDEICEAIELPQYRLEYPKAYEIIMYRVNKKMKLEELLEMIEKKARIISQRHDDILSDMTKAGTYWETHKAYILEQIETGNYDAKYPLAVKLIREACAKAEKRKKKMEQAKSEFSDSSKFTEVKDKVSNPNKKK